MQNKQILIGITGSVALYKVIPLIRNLMAKKYKVRVVMTKAATAFITPLMFESITGQKTACDLFSIKNGQAMEHIDLARWADLIVIVPATAHFIAKMAQGYASDLLSTVILASPKKIVVIPAMNQQMWAHPATQRNIQQLKTDQVEIWGPQHGEQACGDIGLGRMLDINLIEQQINGLFFEKKMAGVRVLITAGPTREEIDPVRFLSNRSSGKMGYAIAQALVFMGAEVTLVSGAVALSAPAGVTLINVESAQQMYQAVMQHISHQAIFIGCAAVADYRIKTTATQKIKKSGQDMILELTPNRDILATVAQLPTLFTLGFAAETEQLEKYAKAKMQAKKLDMIAANQVAGKEGGFERKKNALTVFWKNGSKSLPLCDKNELAIQLIDLLAEQFYAKNANKNTR